MKALKYIPKVVLLFILGMSVVLPSLSAKDKKEYQVTKINRTEKRTQAKPEPVRQRPQRPKPVYSSSNSNSNSSTTTTTTTRPNNNNSGSGRGNGNGNYSNNTNNRQGNGNRNGGGNRYRTGNHRNGNTNFNTNNPRNGNNSNRHGNVTGNQGRHNSNGHGSNRYGSGNNSSNNRNRYRNNNNNRNNSNRYGQGNANRNRHGNSSNNNYNRRGDRRNGNSNGNYGHGNSRQNQNNHSNYNRNRGNNYGRGHNNSRHYNKYYGNYWRHGNGKYYNHYNKRHYHGYYYNHGRRYGHRKHHNYNYAYGWSIFFPRVILNGVYCGGYVNSSVTYYNSEQVVLFEHANYSGNSMILYPGQSISNLSDYYVNSNLSFDNLISSASIAGNVTLVLYSGENFTGDYVYLHNNISNLSNDGQLWPFNDAVSSVKVLSGKYKAHGYSVLANSGYGEPAYGNSLQSVIYSTANQVTSNNGSATVSNASYTINNESSYDFGAGPEAMVVLYDQPNYEGNQLVLKPGSVHQNLATVSGLNGGNWNNTVASIQVMGDVELFVYSDINFYGSAMSLEHNIAHLDKSTGLAEFSGSISSVIVKTSE